MLACETDHSTELCRKPELLRTSQMAKYIFYTIISIGFIFLGIFLAYPGTAVVEPVGPSFIILISAGILNSLALFVWLNYELLIKYYDKTRSLERGLVRVICPAILAGVLTGFWALFVGTENVQVFFILTCAVIYLASCHLEYMAHYGHLADTGAMFIAMSIFSFFFKEFIPEIPTELQETLAGAWALIGGTLLTAWYVDMRWKGCLGITTFKKGD